MSMLRKEWTDEEIMKLGRDMKEAKIKVFINNGFSITEISKVLDVPESVIRRIVIK